ncbi:hypothetical protein [Nocardia terpenica]|uniref:Uncharacterized protein n=1 Tax=Nocardia terpenica TaxID=455432 RepID=A0A164NQ64_9NOCA|nr:hypothetical protein [Nocardia terpenica]KZM74601.1 hypothetical protein AWN90_21195 [Nocardia terpenica]NQE93812.1 hypothetical protein [Nocardia terpenica]
MAEKVNIDYGQAEIAAFKAGAQSGKITFDPHVVDEMVGLYGHLIENLNTELQRIQFVLGITGFGGFPSTQQLAAGFNRKAHEYASTLTQFIEGAVRMQEAFLISGGRITEAEAKNAQAIQLAGQIDGTEKPSS